MQDFAALFEALEQTTKTNQKVAAMAAYFAKAPAADVAWAIHYLSGRRARRVVKTGLLRQWAAESADLPEWLFAECYDAVGDLAETISLIVMEASGTDSRSLQAWMEDVVLPLARQEEAQQHQAIEQIWRTTSQTHRLVLMKLITGGLRLGVSQKLVARALSQAFELPVEVIAHRMMGDWQPDEAFVALLRSAETGDAQLSRPFPFCLAHAIPSEHRETTVTDIRKAAIGSPDDYIAEWKWDGIRGQLIRRQGQTFLWSRGEELMENRWPEIESAAEALPDGTVIDGEILASRITDLGVEVLPFAALQRRIGRKKVGKKLLAEVPVVFHAFDCLESDGQDLRNRPLHQRRQHLSQLIEGHRPGTIVLNPALGFQSWEELEQIRATSREQHAEGLMIKRADSAYTVGRTRGVWWKWKLAPHTVDAVLIYAQRGHGKRASLYTDYTFAVWDAGRLVPFAKAYSGLTDAEITQVDRFIRKNTQERFGPVRSVTPELVMELAFEGLQRSTRHKSGIATRFPRIVRWRQDKRPADADCLDDLLALLPDSEG
ncbi:MAG: ATP-dependent DNA ligase [Planctomycetota bacterium]